MKFRLIMTIIGVITCLSQNVIAQDGEIKKRLVAEYLEFIKEEGYSPTVDSDGDIKFKIEGRTHYIVIYNEESPQYVTFMTSGFQVGGEDGFDYVTSVLAANEVNKQKRTVKLYVTNTSVGVRIEMPFANTESFKRVFYKLISYLDTGRESFIEEYSKLSNQSNNSIVIDNFSVANVEQNQDIISDFDKIIYDYKTKYIKPRMIVTSSVSGDFDLYVKFITPNGLSTGDSSPDGYSYKNTVKLVKGENKYIYLSGWGSNVAGKWSNGSYTIEVWCNDKLIGTKKFDIK